MTEDRDTDRDWEVIGATNPYWGVISAERFKGSALDAASSEVFFKSGVDYVESTLGFIQKHFGAWRPKRSLDFGCGVGRILLGLARHSEEEAVGVDTSRPMLDLAQKHAEQQGVANIRLFESLDPLEQGDERFDFINSFIVLQHIPARRGLDLIDRLIGLTALHGVLSLQLTFAKGAKFLKHDLGQAPYYRMQDGEATLLGGGARRAPVGAINMFDYDLNQVFARIIPIAGHPLMIIPTNHDDHLGVHIIFQRAM